VGTVEAAELRQHLLQKLPAYMVPAAFVHLPQLPLTNNGKIDYAALPSVVCSDGRREPVGARDDTEAQLVQVWQQVLNVAPVGIHDNFFELGGHSLLAVALMEHIERCFARRLPIATLFRQPTIEQLAVLLRGQQAAATWSPLVPIRATGALSPFFCVAGGGGNVLYFQALAQALGADQPFYGLQAAGLDGAVAPLTRIEDMAQANIAALRSVQAQGPYLLGGHCFGGVVAFEMAQQLQRAGQSVALVAIMDIPAPSGRSSAASLDDTAWLVRIAAGIEEVSGKQLALSYEVLATRNAEAQLQLLMERLQQVGFLPAQASLEHVRGLVEVSKANLHALAQFQPREVRPVPIALLRAAAEHPDYAYGSECVIRERDALGWECHAHGPVAIEVVPGNHLTMLIEPHVPVLAQRLAAQLRAAHTRRT
jgi:thioesterase domain-containing protein